MKKYLALMMLVVLCLFPLSSVFASSAQEEIAQGNPPTSECSGFAYYRKFDNDNGNLQKEIENTSSNPINVTLTTTNDDGEYTGFDWSSTEKIGRIVVKSGQGGSNTYTPNSTSGSGSTNDGKEISHITFCWNDPPTYVDVQASAIVGSCTEGAVSEPVTLSVIGATMSITGPQNFTSSGGTYSDLPVGSYSIQYTNLQPGYQLPDPNTLPPGFTIGPCTTKQNVEASAIVGSCIEGAVTEPVTLSVIGATMSITGPQDFTSTGGTYSSLPVGTYSIQYTNLQPEYQLPDPNNLPTGFTIGPCTTKQNIEASAIVGACTEGDETQPVALSVVGATMHVSGPAGFSPIDHTGSQTYHDWPEGVYSLTYTPNEGYEDPGNLPSGFTIGVCENGDEFLDLIVTVMCEYEPGSPCHLWIITNPNNIDIDITWSASTSTASLFRAGYSESGSGTVPAMGTYQFRTSYVAQTMTINYCCGDIQREVCLEEGACEEKQETTTPTDPTEENESTPTPTDIPAGGLGPSAGSFIFLATLGVFGLSLIGILIRKSIVS